MQLSMFPWGTRSPSGCVGDLDGCLIWGFESARHDRVIAARSSEFLKSPRPYSGVVG